MRHTLRRHPGYPCLAASSIDVDVAPASGDRLALSYIVTGTISDVRLPQAAAAARGDKLWEHSCFEIFIRPTADVPYYEFNFSPSTQWAGYHFSRYRGGRRLVTEIDALDIEAQLNTTRYTLRTSLDLGRLPDLPRNAIWRIGLSAIIEETSGRKSYWALAHPPGDADFHHADCFAHEFSPA